MLGIATAVCAFSSCKKDLEEVQQAQPTVVSSAARADLLAGSTWHQTGLLVSTASSAASAASATAGAAAPVSADLFSHVSPGLLEVSTSFSADGTYTVLKGGTGAQPTIGHWQLNTAKDSVTLTLPNQVRRLALTELTPTTMRLSFTDAANGGASTYTTVYAH